MAKEIKNIIFDLGGVLLNLTRQKCLKAFQDIGVENVHELVVSNYMQQAMFKQLENGLISVEEFHDSIRETSKLPHITGEEIDQAWIQMIDSIPSYKLDFLLSLRKEYRLFLLSNTNQIHWEHVSQNDFVYKEHTIESFFEKIYLSYKMQLLKPCTEVYEYLLADAGICAEETLFVDDALTNCNAAQELGIRTFMPEANVDWTEALCEILNKAK